jgi:hypothetical protein
MFLNYIPVLFGSSLNREVEYSNNGIWVPFWIYPSECFDIFFSNGLLPLCNKYIQVQTFGAK